MRSTFAAIGILVIVVGILFFAFARSSGRSAVRATRVQQARAKYITDEGHTARGDAFNQLVSSIDRGVVASFFGEGITKNELFDLLGPPDLERKRGGEWFVYYYDRFGTKDWYVSVSFVRDDRPIFGYNASTQLNLNDWTTYQPLEQPNKTNQRKKVAGRN